MIGRPGSPDTESDRQLVRSFLDRRDEASFRALYRRHSPRMFSLARLTVRSLSLADAEEVMQEAWVRAARDLPRFEWRSSLSSWLCGILINVCRESVRREIRERVRDDGLERLEQLSPGTDPIDIVMLGEALDQLPAGYRKVVVLHDVGGFTHEEIGEILAIDPGTSKSQLSRARARLRLRLRGEGG